MSYFHILQPEGMDCQQNVVTVTIKQEDEVADVVSNENTDESKLISPFLLDAFVYILVLKAGLQFRAKRAKHLQFQDTSLVVRKKKRFH